MVKNHSSPVVWSSYSAHRLGWTRSHRARNSRLNRNRSRPLVVLSVLSATSRWGQAILGAVHHAHAAGAELAAHGEPIAVVRPLHVDLGDHGASLAASGPGSAPGSIARVG